MTQNIDNAGAELICPECGYDLRGLPSDRCPECGKPFDRATVWRSRIPWTHRESIGRIRAYARTVWMATGDVRTLCLEVARPVSLGDAQRFRLITVLLASLAPVAVLVTIIQMAGGTAQIFGLGAIQLNGAGLPPAIDFTLPWAAGALLWPTMPIAIVVFLFLVSGVASYWFHPRSLPVVQQNRAVALSHYCFTPLVWTAFPILSVALVGYFDDRGLLPRSIGRSVGPFVVVTCTVLVYTTWLVMWFNTLRLLRRAANASGWRVTCCAIGLPISWALCAGIAFGILPWLVGYIFLMIDSMRK